MIIAKFLSSFPVFPNYTFLIIKSCPESTAEKQGKIWWPVARWDGLEVPLVQVILGGFWVILDSFYWLGIISGGFRWFAVLAVTQVSQHAEQLTLYYTHGRT